MEMEILKYVGAGVAACGMIGSGIGLGLLFGNYLTAVARQPSMEKQLKTVMFLGLALIEGIAIFALVLAFMIFFA